MINKTELFQKTQLADMQTYKKPNCMKTKSTGMKQIGSCLEQSGSPLMFKSNDNRWVIYGLTSAFHFTLIDQYIDWIFSQIYYLKFTF